MIESVLEFLQGQNVRCKIGEALMWLNVSGGMFNFSLCITAVNRLALLHWIAQDCREENGTMFNSAAKEKCKQVQSGKILLSFRSVQTFL